MSIIHHVIRKVSKEKKDENRESGQEDGFAEALGETLESPSFTFLIIILIQIDLACTIICALIEKTDLINPKYEATAESFAEHAKTVGVSILCVFIFEQLLRMVAFGIGSFFSHIWFVSDLVVVSLSLACETVLEHQSKFLPRLAVFMRLWMVIAFVFDICLLEHERAEREEVLAEAEEKKEL